MKPAADWQIFEKYRRFALGNSLQLWRSMPGWTAGDYQCAAEYLYGILCTPAFLAPIEPGTRDGYVWVRELLEQHFKLEE